MQRRQKCQRWQKRKRLRIYSPAPLHRQQRRGDTGAGGDRLLYMRQEMAKRGLHKNSKHCICDHRRTNTTAGGDPATLKQEGRT